MRNQYDVLWKAGEPVEMRYIRLRRLDSERTNWASIRSFVVTPAAGASLAFGGDAAASDGALLAFDHRPCTAFKNTGAVSFEVPHGTTSYTFLLSLPEGGSVSLRQYDRRNRLKAETSYSDPFFTAAVAKGAARIELVGKADVYEIIPKRK